MTNADQLNCKFEPATGSLADQSHATVEVRKMFEEEASSEAFTAKLGANLGKLHPEVLKKGKLKQAQHLAKQGEFAKAKSTLSDAFNILSLKRRFDPKFQRQLAVKQAMQAGKADRVNAAEAAKVGLSAENATRSALVDKLAHMREKVEDQQVRVPPEDFENKKLFPVLEAAYDLVALVESREAEALKKAAKVEEAREKLKLK